VDVPSKRCRPDRGAGSHLLILFVAVLVAFAGFGMRAPVARAAPRAAAEQAPALRLPDLGGTVRRLDEWRGKVVILNFWATWCPTCQYETPDLMRYQRDYGASGLQVVGVGLDEGRKLENFRRTFDMNYPILRAEPARSAALLAAWGDGKGVLPYTVILDREGRVLYRHVGRFNDMLFDDFVRPLLQARQEREQPSA
jgi:peroxiredoxin